MGNDQTDKDSQSSVNNVEQALVQDEKRLYDVVENLYHRHREKLLATFADAGNAEFRCEKS